MMDQDSNHGYSFTLTEIKLLERTLYPYPKKNADRKDVSFIISLEIGHNVALEECIYKMQVVTVSKESEKPIGSIVLSCVFQIPNLEGYMMLADEDHILPKDLLYLLNTVVIGTMRGVMFTEFRGTVLNDAYLPVVDPREFEKAN